MKKIMLSAGGTAGHVFPACSLSLELKKKGYYTTLITDQRGKKYVNKEFDEVIVLPISKLGLKMIIFSPYIFFRCLTKIFNVESITTFGGYTSFFPILAGILTLKKIFIVQLDSIVTRLNSLFLNYASKVFYLFPQTNFKKFEPYYYLTGIPIRSGFEFSFIKHTNENFTISILGGSLGSPYWKDLIFQFSKELSENLRSKISLFIQTKEDISFLDQFFFKSVTAQPFFDTKELFKKSHLIITRCGANTLAEIASVGRPAFLVPWKESIANHQVKNAENFTELGGCAMGDYLSLYDFFMKLYSDESFFVKACSDISTAFEFDGKKKIINLMM